MKEFFKNNSGYFYVVFRIIVGLVFFLHGFMKIQAITGGQMSLVSLMGLAMLIESVGGLFLVIGMFVRHVAVIAALEMAYAYIFVHTFGNGFVPSPLVNGGEAALLFFAAFLILAALGAKKFGIDKE